MQESLLGHFYLETVTLQGALQTEKSQGSWPEEVSVIFNLYITESLIRGQKNWKKKFYKN